MTDVELMLFLLKQEKKKENMRHKEKIAKINKQIDDCKKQIDSGGDK